MKTYLNVIGLSMLIASGHISAELNPRTFELGAIDLTPTLTVSETYNDNFARQQGGDANSSLISRMMPVISLVTKRDSNAYSLQYSGEYGVYHSSRDDNYVDHTLSALFSRDPNVRNKMSLAVTYARDHDNRGTGLSQGAVARARTEPDRVESHTVEGSWKYGTATSALNLEFKGGFTEKSYLNNLEFTRRTGSSEQRVSSRLLGQLNGSIRWYIGYSFRDIGYSRIGPVALSALDSDRTVVSAGISWRLTGKTSGHFQLDQTSKDFSEPQFDDSEFLGWQGHMKWALTDYASLTFSTSRRENDSFGVGDFFITARHSAGWDHEWSSSLNTSANLVIYDIKYENSERRDDGTQLDLSASYDFRRWARVSMKYSLAERKTGFEGFEYERNAFSVTTTLSF